MHFLFILAATGALAYVFSGVTLDVASERPIPVTENGGAHGESAVGELFLEIDCTSAIVCTDAVHHPSRLSGDHTTRSNGQS